MNTINDVRFHLQGTVGVYISFSCGEVVGRQDSVPA
jgi:hypothetical protein